MAESVGFVYIVAANALPARPGGCLDVALFALWLKLNLDYHTVHF